MLIYIDNTENGPMLSESTVFEENYALLYSVITDVSDPLMKWFVDEKVFIIEEEKEITAINEPPERLRLLLLKISNSLKANNATYFYMMLKIMREHGGKGTRTLAVHIMNRLKLSINRLSEIWCDNNPVKNDETKG